MLLWQKVRSFIMKYFVLQDSPELKNAPQITRWYEQIDVRDIRADTCYKQPEKQVFRIISSERLVFTDIILFPFFLVSPMVYEVILMYREACLFRKVFLAEAETGKAQMYYLPVMEESSDIALKKISYKNGCRISESIKNPKLKVFDLKKNLFWIRESQKRHIILSMDMAESLIRRGVSGLGLSEVELEWKKDEKTAKFLSYE